MASMWGNNSLAPNSSAGWFFYRTAGPGQAILPYISVMPLSNPNVTPLSPAPPAANWTLTNGGYPYVLALGISTQWVTLQDINLTEWGYNYYIVVQNNAPYTIEYAFVEADF